MKPTILLTTLFLAAACAPTTPPDEPEPGAMAEMTEPENLNLVGNRFAPLTWDEMTDAQKTMVTHILDGPRNALGGPFNVLLRSPEMGDMAQELGAYARFNSSLPGKLREMAIIMTARFWMSHFEWYAHKNAALAEGLDPGNCRSDCDRTAPTRDGCGRNRGLRLRQRTTVRQAGQR